MKLAPLLAQFLYTNKRLDLPGIGTFSIDPTIHIEEENGKHGKPVELKNIFFQNDPSNKNVSDLVNYISSQTGKMKPLAAADLDSHLELAQEFLNIGKPFLFEGIGNLVKIRSGQYEFSAAHVVNEKIKEFSPKEIIATSSDENSFTDYENILLPRKSTIKWNKSVLFLFMLAGLGLAVWGGYRIAKSRTAKKNTLAASEMRTSIAPVTIMDSSTLNKKTDSIVSQPQVIPAGNYKFVLEIANQRRAFERYNKLKSYQWNVQMETKDSLKYKLFLVLPAAAKDTTRIADSLTVMNGRKVFVENLK